MNTSLPWVSLRLLSSVHSYWYLISSQGSPPSPRSIVVVAMTAITSLRSILWGAYIYSQPISILDVVLYGGLEYFSDYLIWVLTARNQLLALRGVDYVGIGFFVVGSLLESLADLRRKWWKDSNPPGKPYVEGFNAVVQHPNYLGYMIWRCSHAVLSGNMIYAGLIGFFNLVNFVVFAIPSLQKKNCDKYGPAYTKYIHSVPRLIPKVY